MLPKITKLQSQIWLVEFIYLCKPIKFQEQKDFFQIFFNLAEEISPQMTIAEQEHAVRMVIIRLKSNTFNLGHDALLSQLFRVILKLLANLPEDTKSEIRQRIQNSQLEQLKKMVAEKCALEQKLIESNKLKEKLSGLKQALSDLRQKLILLTGKLVKLKANL
jgi:hypothetical protein